MKGGLEVLVVIVIITFYGEAAYAGHRGSVVSQVQFEPVFVLVAFETHRTGELPLGKIIFEWGETFEIECDWHLWRGCGCLGIGRVFSLFPFILKSVCVIVNCLDVVVGKQMKVLIINDVVGGDVPLFVRMIRKGCWLLCCHRSRS